MDARKAIRFLGWFSLGLGLAEIVAPQAFARMLGTKNRTGLVRTAYGLREVAAGAGLLSGANPRPWLWARVGGDALDLATLGGTLSSPGSKRRNAAIALASVAAVTVLDVLTVRRLSQSNGQVNEA